MIILDSQSTDEEINVSMSLHFIKCMTLLEVLSNDSICVIINSTGGDIHSSFAIYDRILESPCHVCVRGYGAVMSGASIIMQAATIREMSPNSYMMIHDGSVMLQDDMNKAKSWIKAYDDMSSKMYEIYFDRAKKKNKKLTKEQISVMCKEETILNAQQALELGFIDQIYKG
jgi:ATP-dependent protease ClpP protease subunit